MERRRDLLVVGLALVTGAMDAVGFLGGGVFASVQTGNLVLFGLGVGSGRDGLVLRAGLAFVGYCVGVAGGGRLTRRAADSPAVWPSRVTVVLSVELALLVAFAVGWELASANPTGTLQASLIVVAGMAMGAQSAAIRAFGVQGLATTYLTGTVTVVVSELAGGRRPAHVGRDLGILGAVVMGAVAAGVVLTTVPRAAMLIPLAVLTGVVVSARVAFGARDASDPGTSRASQ